jgi:hypothetical protein
MGPAVRASWGTSTRRASRDSQIAELSINSEVVGGALVAGIVQGGCQGCDGAAAEEEPASAGLLEKIVEASDAGTLCWSSGRQLQEMPGTPVLMDGAGRQCRTDQTRPKQQPGRDVQWADQQGRP